jgi:hypothetical protein
MKPGLSSRKWSKVGGKFIGSLLAARLSGNNAQSPTPRFAARSCGDNTLVISVTDDNDRLETARWRACNHIPARKQSDFKLRVIPRNRSGRLVEKIGHGALLRVSTSVYEGTRSGWTLRVGGSNVPHEHRRGLWRSLDGARPDTFALVHNHAGFRRQQWKRQSALRSIVCDLERRRAWRMGPPRKASPSSVSHTKS